MYLKIKKIKIRNKIINKHRYTAVVTQSPLSEGRRNHCARRLRDGAAHSDLGRLRCPGLVAIRFVTGTVSTPFDDVTVVLVAAWRWSICHERCNVGILVLSGHTLPHNHEVSERRRYFEVALTVQCAPKVRYLHLYDLMEALDEVRKSPESPVDWQLQHVVYGLARVVVPASSKPLILLPRFEDALLNGGSHVSCEVLAQLWRDAFTFTHQIVRLSFEVDGVVRV